MRRGPTPVQQPSCTKEKGARAYRGYILCASSFPSDEVDRLDIAEGFHNAWATGQANQVERRTAFEGAGGHDNETAVARNRQHSLCDNVCYRFKELAGGRD